MRKILAYLVKTQTRWPSAALELSWEQAHLVTQMFCTCLQITTKVQQSTDLASRQTGASRQI